VTARANGLLTVIERQPKAACIRVSYAAAAIPMLGVLHHQYTQI
jgi:hypothetical protein